MTNNQVMLGGVWLNCLSQDEAVRLITERMAKRQYKRPLTVFTPNTEQVIQARDNPAFLRVLNAAGIRVPDSVGLVQADWWRAFCTGRAWQVRERVAGADLAESLLFEAAQRKWRVVLVGGVGDSSQKATERLKKRFSGLDIWHVRVGRVEVTRWKLENKSENLADVKMENENEVIQKINKIKPDLMLVGLGAPKQEVWVLKYGGKLRAQVAMVVGGTIDYWSGVQKRAPKWVRWMGVEWLWRLVKQPWRAGRQLRLIRFGWLVLTGKI